MRLCQKRLWLSDRIGHLRCLPPSVRYDHVFNQPAECFSGVNEPQESRIVWKVMNYWRLQMVISLVILVTLVGSLNAERVHTLRSTVSLVASLDDNPRLYGDFGSSRLPDDLFFTYGIYPSIELNSTGSHSSLGFHYSFGLNRVESEIHPDSDSHTFGGEVNAQLTRNLRLRFFESFTRSSDLRTFNLFRGVLFTPEGIFFESETIAVPQNRYENTASMTLDYTLSPNSALSGGFGHSLRKFQENLPSFTRQLSNQNGFNGNLQYNQTIGPRTRWNLGYSAFLYDFEEFEGGRTHHGRVDLSHQISPSVSLSLGTGPSYTEASSGQSSFFSFKNGSLSISKSLEDSLLSLSYWRRSGTSTGVGSLSDAQTLDLRFSRPIGRRTTVSSRVSFYDTQGLLDNPVDTRGISASLLFDFLLERSWVLVLGGSYQNQQGINTFDVGRNRVFISLRYTLPELLRF